MEGTASEKKMKEEAIITESATVVEEFSDYNPCYYAQEALKALLKCLGFDGSPRPDQPASSSSEDGENQQVQVKPGCQETHDSGPGEAADPPSSTDPPADPPATSVEASDATSRRLGRKPPPPPVDTGPGPVTH
ncbi:uncharacterized protein LOC127800065 [Diospyros lotus]|uniref:uncharacterized protein LOC127800065 n=1 Tax=Diospyros lotus TaxID=55363 RepID=UPI0022558FEE|nr:uncharacterized protein LOC127800065 [Diospyros lotus]